MKPQYMPAAYVAERAGTRDWVLTARLTDRLRERGFTRAVHPREYKQWEADWLAGLPRCEHCGQVLP